MLWRMEIVIPSSWISAFDVHEHNRPSLTKLNGRGIDGLGMKGYRECLK